MHSRTAPESANAFSDLFVGDPELVLPRSKTERKEPSRHDLQIDRLPDGEKVALCKINFFRLLFDMWLKVFSLMN